MTSVPADTHRETGTPKPTRRERAVRFFRDIHGTERVWRSVPLIETFVESAERTEELYGLVVCTNRHAAGAR
jgi:hypothetical protein